MKKQVQQLYEKYLELTEGDKAGAASLTLADVMFKEPESPIPESLTIAEAAKRLRVAPNTIYLLCARGEINHHRVGRAIRLCPADIEEYRRHSTQESRPRGRYRFNL
jgi:excisionase family DNA binding protein